MTYGKSDYWLEAVEIAFNDEGLSATQEQIANIAGAMEISAENQGMAFGYDAIPNPLDAENQSLKRDLEREQNKLHCKQCNGSGWITINGGVRSSTSQCWKCHGDGRTDP